MSNLVIRADASPRIGTGHVMRCLALAQDWLADGGRVLCVCASLPGALERLLRIEGCDVTRIECEPGSADDARATLLALHRWIADSYGTSNLRRPTPELGGPTAGFWLVADGYRFGSDYQRETKEKGWRLLLMDDYGHASHYHADFVLNQNLHAHAGLYAHREPGTQLLLGPKYALLRRQFKPWRDWRREVPTVARKVLVTLGGADPDNVTGDVADALRGLGIEAKFVVGGSNPHIEALRARTRDLEGSELVVNARNMPELMAWADVAVAAGGTTSWELAFMGLPSLVLILADNQRALAGALAAEGVARITDPRTVASDLAALGRERDTRRSMSERGRALADGEGAARVSACLRSIALSLRPVQPEDCRMIWEWANEVGTRAASFSPAPIPWASHETWFAARLRDPDCRFYLAANGEGIPIGQIRFDEADDEAVVSISLARDARGRGFGPALILAGARRCFAETPARAVRADIRPDNVASISAFARAGFTDAGETDAKGRRARQFILRRGNEC